MRVVFFHRRPRPDVNFSVENLFKQIRSALSAKVQWRVKELSFFSEGFFKRLYICLEAAFNQEEVNHITGDVNFIALFLRKRRTVLTILDLGLMNHPNKFSRLVLKWFWVVMPVRRSAVIVTISTATKQELLKYVRVDPSRIRVIYVPISPSFKSTPKAFNKKCPRILQIGTAPNKNVIRLVQALRGISCELEIVGPVNEELKTEIQKSELMVYTSINITNEEMLEKYKAADILAFVSTYEGFGMPIVEGNAMGRVVVTSNILSMPEVAGNAAHLVDPFDVVSIRNGILKVMQEDDYRERLIANGFVNKQRFDVIEIARQYTEVYKTISN